MPTNTQNDTPAGQSPVLALAHGSAGSYFPKTLRGWKALFWLALGRCPKCKQGLCQDPWSWDDATAYCMPCGGAMYPNGLVRTLRCNKVATAKSSLPNK
jgi:hypothetical protein